VHQNGPNTKTTTTIHWILSCAQGRRVSSWRVVAVMGVMVVMMVVVVVVMVVMALIVGVCCRAWWGG
jgi:hypothetical protein